MERGDIREGTNKLYETEHGVCIYFLVICLVDLLQRVSGPEHIARNVRQLNNSTVIEYSGTLNNVRTN
jgi:hypothetical protein